MRRLCVAAVLAATVAVAGPHLGAGAVPGIAALHDVRQLLACDAHAIDQLRVSPRTAPDGCGGIVHALATISGAGAAKP